MCRLIEFYREKRDGNKNINTRNKTFFLLVSRSDTTKGFAM
jgi:hypothetical protein